MTEVESQLRDMISYILSDTNDPHMRKVCKEVDEHFCIGEAQNYEILEEK